MILKYMKIFNPIIKLIKVWLNRSFLFVVLLFVVFSFHSCKRWSKAGRATMKANSRSNPIEHLVDTVNSTPEKNPIIPPIDTTPIPDNKIEPNQPIPPNPVISIKKSISELFKELQNGVFIVYTIDKNGVKSQGSGFFINPDGIGITNYHVLKGYKKALIQTSDGKTYQIAKILESSTADKNDYVIFQIDADNTYFKCLPVALKQAQIGDEVFAIGSPRGLENTLTKGIVSQYRKTYNRIQIDATIDHGSSGGPLFNMDGEVIGITTSGMSGSALNFAVDIQVVPFKKYITRFKNKALFHSHSSNSGHIIYHSYFTVSYNDKHKNPEWVAYKITTDNFNNKVKRTNDYREDPFVSTGTAHPDDFRGSGYDMGHLAPARTMSHNFRSMSESFYLSNISPQRPEFNRGIWKRLEQKVQYWSFFNDSTYVATGPILKNPIDKIGYNDVSVPSAFYKVLVGFKDGKVKGIAFIMPNKGSDRSIYSYATSIDYVEEITGIDFFYNLDKEIQDKIEANRDLKKWSLR